MHRTVRTSVTALVLALLALTALPRLQSPASAAPRASGQIVAKEIRQESPASHGGRIERLGGASGSATAAATAASVGAPAGDTLSWTSDVIDAGQQFDHVAVHWQAVKGAEDRVFVEIRTSADGRTWTEWSSRISDEDMFDEGKNEVYSAPLPVDPSRYAQYRLWFTDGDVADVRAAGLTFLDVTDLNAGPLARLSNDLAGAWRDFANSFSAAAAVNAPVIHSRQEWGANESLMQWIPEYSPWKKAVVHHTVTSNTYTDPTAEIRAIYYYHAVTRGWGDIGYNFLVDRFGGIWTGRQGGDDVVGGHAYGWNYGSMGVATLGTFSTAAPSNALLAGVAQIIAVKFAQRGVQPLGADPFIHKEEDASGNWVPISGSPPNILGHRDCNYILGQNGGQTECPGNMLYAQLPGVRANAQNLVNGGFNNLVFIQPALAPTANVGATLQVPVTISNKGGTAVPGNATRLSYRVVDSATGATVVSQGTMTNIPADIPVGGQQIVMATLNVPNTAGRYIVRWDLFGATAGWWSMAYSTPVRDQWLAAVDWDDTWISDNTPPTMAVGQSYPLTVTVQNTGARAWPAAYVHLSYHWVSDVTDRVVVWNGSRANLPFDVQPGQTVQVPITVAAPSYPTRYQLQYDLVWEGQFWFGDKGVEPDVKIVNIPFDYHAAYSVQSGPLTLMPNQSTTVPVTVTNTGTSTWPASGTPFVELGTHWYTTGGAQVQWDGARTALPSTLGPGQSATMQANLTAPAAPGAYTAQFDLSLEGISWFSSRGVAPASLPVTVKTPSYGARYQPGALGSIASSVQTTIPMTLTNTGDIAWTPPAFDLGFHVYDASNRLVVWDGTRTFLPATIQPGQSVSLQANLVLPAGSSAYTIQWDMVNEGVAWFSQKGVAPAAQTVIIGAPSYRASYSASLTPAAMATLMTTRVLVGVTNASSFPFSAATNTYLSYHWYDAAGNVVTWDGARSPINLGAGQSGQFWVGVVGPAATGSYKLGFDLVQEGVTWFSGQGVAQAVRNVAVVVPQYGAVYAAPGDQSAAAGSAITVPVTVTNSGSLTWTSPQVNLAYHLTVNGATYVWDGARTALPAALAPGQSVTVNATINVPGTPGSYQVRFDLVQEGVTWFSGQGVPVATFTLTAQ